MDSLEDSLKRIIKESVREVLRESEFRQFQQLKDNPRPLPSTPISKKLAVKIDEAAEMLSLSVPTLRRLIANGSLKVSRKTRHLLIPIEEIKRMMDI
jgi:excisionase family DNA binding protein